MSAGGTDGGEAAGGVFGKIEVGAYGKTEAQADFLRIGAGGFSQAGLDRWFEEALETMRAEGGRLPETPTRFLLAPRGVSQVFLGVFSPSQDAAGRSSAMLVFTEIDAALMSEGVAGVLGTYAPFLAEAVVLATEGGRLSASDLGARIHGVLPQGISLAFDPRADAGLASAPARDLSGAFGVVPRALGYALRTLGLACDQASKTGPDARSGVITVDAPWPTPAVFSMWLDLVRRRLRWREGVPSLLWTEATEESGGRLLITLGPPSASALAYLANPRHRSPRFWPLRTEVQVALDQAFEALAPEQRRLLENPAASLGELAAAFGA